MNDMITWDDTKSGTRLSDIPGARCLKTVVMISTAPMRPAISVKVIICAQTSIRLPGEYAGPASGTYANHPASGPVFAKNATYNSTPPIRYIQYPRALSRGNETFLVPIMIGTIYRPTASIT